mmetsp:Transcript_9716/g.28842  ORF Transcript_9716/g.28842 Transcript_9716/m.28842 type:complete len:452 (-) Transcript_9716:126-1481(-)
MLWSRRFVVGRSRQVEDRQRAPNTRSCGARKREAHLLLIVERTVNAHTRLKKLNFRDGSAAIVGGGHVRVGGIGHHHEHPRCLHQRGCVAVRGVPHSELRYATLVELRHELICQGLRHALLVELAAHHHRGHTSRCDVVDYRVCCPHWLLFVLRPVRLLHPLSDLFLLPLVESRDPFDSILDTPFLARHIAVASDTVGAPLPGPTDKPAVNKQDILVDEPQLAQVKDVVQAAPGMDTADDFLGDLIIRNALYIHFPQQCHFSLLPFELSVCTHRVLVDPAKAIGEGVGLIQHGIRHLFGLAIEILCDHLAEENCWIDTLVGGHPRRPPNILAAIVLGGRVALARETQLVQVAVAEKQNDTIGMLALQAAQGPSHADGAPTRGGSLVARVATMNEAPALLQLHVGGARLVEDRLPRRKTKSVAGVHIPLEVLPVAFDVGDERYLGGRGAVAP